MPTPDNLEKLGVALLLAIAPLAAQVPLLKVHGDYAGTSFGRYAARIGDVNGDQVADFITGIPQSYAGIGSARVFSGRDGKVIYDLKGDPTAKAQFGASVGRAGDINHDGVDDFLVGGSVHKKTGILAGYISLMSGKDGTVIRVHYGDGPGDLFGTSVAGVGDIDGDGYDDYAAGAPENGDPVRSYGKGYAKLFSGRDGSLMYQFVGYQLMSEFGHSVAAAGDVDKDGTPDILIGSTLEGQGNGSARLFSGKTKKVIFNFPAPQDGDHFGVVVSGAGDIDRDGYRDVLVGGPNPYAGIVGRVWAFSGRTGKALYSVKGPPTAAMFGMSVLDLGDVNGDGYADFAGGDPGDSTSSKGGGSVRGISGRDGSELFVIYGKGGMFGVVCDTMGDINGDGLVDLLCAAPLDNVGGTQRGTLGVHSLKAVDVMGKGCVFRGSPPRLGITQPLIGHPATIGLTGNARSNVGLFLSAIPGTPLHLSGNCYAHLDLASMMLLRTGRTDSYGDWQNVVWIPNSQLLRGAEMAIQATIEGTAGPDLSNGVHFLIR